MKLKVALGIAILAFVIYGFTSREQAPQKATGVVKIGQVAPDMTLKNMNGKTMKLSDFRGKLVLIDFWASWCPPCRRENPHLVKAYKHYKDKKFKNAKGFTVFGVSLDGGRRGNEQTWKKAIKDDGLIWESNCLGNTEVAMQYNIRTIPTNFLLDEKGVVIATNLRGNDLEKKLESLLK